MRNASSLTKEELIANLWLTDELISEFDILEEEIKKKNISLQAAVEEAQIDYLRTVEESYYQSAEYHDVKQYEGLVEKFKKNHLRIIFINVIICILIGYVLIYLGLEFWHVLLFWLIVPAAIYGGYRGWQFYYLNSKSPNIFLNPIEDVLLKVKESQEFQQQDSLLVRHLKQEIENLEQRKLEGEQKLAAQMVLPLGYRQRIREIIWYLESIESYHLTEALMALDEADYRERTQHMLENQQNEIRNLKDNIEMLIEENRIVKEQQKQLLEQSNGIRGISKKKKKK